MTDEEKRGEAEVALPKNVVNAISKVAAEKAITEYNRIREEGIKRRRDGRLRNAKLLIKKYKWLKEYGDNAIYKIGQLVNSDEYQILESFGLITSEMREVEGIRNSVTVTRIILKHVETMLNLYKYKCENSQREEDRRRWRVLYDMYLADKTKDVIAIAEEENINERTAYKDIDFACNELSTLFFGIDIENLLKL